MYWESLAYDIMLVKATLVCGLNISGECRWVKDAVEVKLMKQLPSKNQQHNGNSLVTNSWPHIGQSM